ncbi:MAG: hypothetical protein H6659_15115 [Ardenticatenaceae bacterium]|nr:hypothetical protein [Ardenticatenaceae bacterium]MCB8986702.1 hypothetical protein [Ardenticatenaceae bacterium]
MNPHRTSLDGQWDFQIGAAELAAEAATQEWRTAVVPMPWQAQFDDLRHTSGTAWYRRHFVIEPEWLETAVSQAAILHFGAVDYQATVWLNGECVGAHEGGYLPFEFEVIGYLHAGENELLVRVIDATDDRDRYPNFPFSEVPHGKQSWYGPLGGIWQSVWLEFRPRVHIAHLSLNPRPDEAAISVAVELSSAPHSGYEIALSVTDPAGNEVGSEIVANTSSGVVRLGQPPRLWSPDEPHLYTATAVFRHPNQPDHITQKVCGFRTVAAKNGRIYLNGQPIYLRGVLDQAYYPETIYTPPSLDMLEMQATEIKRLGFNCLRTHIKIEDPRYYDVADRLGLLIWTEIPNWALLTEAVSVRAKQTFAGMVKRDNHHPSIIVWTLINENWGTDLSRNPEHRRWLADFYREAKAIDPTRLIVDNSACLDNAQVAGDTVGDAQFAGDPLDDPHLVGERAGNAHVAGDIEDYHYYRAIPDHACEWDEWVADFAGRNDWTWYKDYAQERRADLPLLVSEFGNWGLPDLASIHENGAEPWWFETGSEWDDGIVYPHGAKQRYAACGLADLFSSYSEFAQQSQAHMARSLHYEITTMRLHEAVAGYVITEFTDVHWECNGLLTMQRETKHLLDPLLKDLNQERVVLLRPLSWNGRPGQAIEVMVQTVGIVGQETGGVIHWRAGEAEGSLQAPGGTISLTLDEPGVYTLSAQWVAENDVQIAANQVNLVCVAAPEVDRRLRVVDNPALAAALHQLSYDVAEGRIDGHDTGDILIASRYTGELQDYLQRGGRVLLLAQAESAASREMLLPAGKIVARNGTPWQGDWASSLAWVKKQGVLAHLPGGPLLEMEWSSIMPDAVIAGLPSWVLRDHSWAGLAVGWVHKAVSLLSVLRYGHGQILITTFKINAETLSTDAIAQALFAGMVNLL